ncbi:MAG TPA: Ig-like domain-containing protein [Planctomycetota bacterium]|nr:Ig-like domain-containing protein [Planctomycetota bacterium]
MFQQRNSLAVLCVVVFVGVLAAPVASALTIGTVSVVSPANPAQVPLYGKIELLIPLTTTSTKPYEAAPAQGGVDLSSVFTAPNATTATIKGYYDGSAWRIRFAPTQTGVWQAAVSVTDSTGTVNAAAINFTCVASSYPGFAQINGKYIQFTNGTAFYAVGHNNGWQQDVEQPTEADMASQGENLLSFWMAAPWGLPTDSWWMRRTPIENSVGGIGNYDQNACGYLDSVVANAEAAGIYLLPSIWAHDELCDGTVPSGWPASWSNNAYSNVCTATNFYQTTVNSVDTTQWRLQKNYYRYILARWGYSRAIVGFVGVVEIDGTTGYANNSTQANSWCTSLRTYFATNDKYRLNTASAYPLIITRVDQPTYDPGMNMRGTDSYTSKNSNTAVAATIASEIATMRASGKPGMFAEFGGDVLNGASQPAHLHNGIWAGTAAGTALTPLLWCDGGNYPMLTSDMRTHLKILNQFVGALDYPINNSLAAATPTVPTGFKAWSQQLSNRGFVWIQNTTGGSVGGQTLTVSSLAAGTYSVAWYDVWTSGCVPFATTPSVTVSTTLSVTLPSLARPDLVGRFFLNSGAPSISSVSASPNPVNSTTTALAVVANDDGGEAALTYTWATVGNPPSPVSFSASGTNAAKNSTATFAAAGAYQFQVTVKDLGGKSSTQTVNVTVNAVPSQGLTVSPPSAIVGLGATQQFTASALDQFGNPVAVSAAWSVDDGGTISASGLFTAGFVGGGQFTITATLGTLSGTAEIGVIDAPPSVSLTSPTEGAIFAARSTVSLAANASDDAAVASVAFYANGMPLGTVTSAPYAFAWTNAPAGSYSLTAIATDSVGHTTQSVAINVLVDALPTVCITSPQDSTVFLSGTAISFSADASDADGTVVQVDFYAGSTLIGTAASAPYAMSWSPAPGTYSVTAKATDNLGFAACSAPISVSVDGPPTVGISSPAGGAQLNVGASVVIIADAEDDFGVESVAFYASGSLLGTANSGPPYSFEWDNLPAGVFSLTAVATDSAGQETQSAGVTILVDAPPTVALSAPANNSTYGAGSNITLSADAADSDGTVAKVDFYAGATLIGTVTAAPFSITWTNPSPGVYALTAIATDDLGAATTSSPVTVTVDAPPTVCISSPSNGATFAANSTITIAANASDDVAVASVAFYANGALLGNSTSAPYSISWPNVSSGSYALMAIATDSFGQSTQSATVNIVVNTPPSVSLTAPANNAVFTTGTQVTLQAAAADSDGTVAQVQFYAGSTLVGTAATAPYSATWNPAAGSYVLTAKATDNLGATTVSAPVSVTINTPPTVSLTAPANNAVFTAGANITVSASASDSDGSVAKVEFYAGAALIGTATSAPYSVVWTNPAKGTYTLTAKATDNSGATTVSAARTVIVNAPPTCAITSPANNASFARNSTVTITASAADSDGTIASVAFVDNGVTIGTDTASPYSHSYVPAKGAHVLTVTATDNRGATTTSAAVTITVR